MRFGSDELRGALTGGFNHEWSADLYYNGDLRISDVPILEPSMSEDADASIQQSGSVTVVWTDEFATSLTPRFVTDPLAPFGAQLFLYSVVTAGGFSERVPFGRFEITDVPSARDELMRFRGEWITVGSTVQLEVKELLAGVAQESFDVPSSPVSLASTWDELGRITGLPLSRTVTDVPITRSVMYPDSKLDAVYDLMGVMLDAVPHVTPVGVLSARSNTWPAPADTLTLDVLESVGASMSASQIYNRVVVRATGGDQQSVLAVSEITSGPLRARNTDGSVSPFRARTRYLSSEFVTTVAQARAWADSELARVSTIRSYVVPVVETFNPLRERGDVVVIERPTEFLLGRVVTIRRSDRATQALTVEIAGSSPRTDPVGPFDGDGPWLWSLYPGVDLFPAFFLLPGRRSG